MDLILEVEMELNGLTDDKGVASIMTDLIQNDLVLRKWVIGGLKLEKDWKFKLKKKFALTLEKMPKFKAHLKRVNNFISPMFWNMKSVVSIHLDFVKDVLLFLAMNNFTNIVLVSPKNQLFYEFHLFIPFLTE